MMEKRYSCNICRDPKKPEELFGCNFSNLHDFKLDEAKSTDGVHICEHCMRQLKAEIKRLQL